MTVNMTITRPDDWHVHFRDGDNIGAVAAYTARQFGRATVMPNLIPAITDVEMAIRYKKSIEKALSNSAARDGFTPIMTIAINDHTTPKMIREARVAGFLAAKNYFKNTTTNSGHGISDITKLIDVFKAMSDYGMISLNHGETLVSANYGDKTRNGRVGILQREPVFMRETAEWLVGNFPDLKIVMEHITTTEAVDFVKKCGRNVGATITAHHLLATLDDVFESHHNKCMPVLKEEPQRQALLKAATSGNPKFFGGTDTAPHSKSLKETACGCAGCFTAICAVELYATAFEEVGKLDMLEGFLSHFGADFYGLQRNQDTITLKREKWNIPQEVMYGAGETLVPFWAGKELSWKFVG